MSQTNVPLTDNTPVLAILVSIPKDIGVTGNIIFSEFVIERCHFIELITSHKTTVFDV